MTVVGRLGASFGWTKDRDKHVDKDKGTTGGMAALPEAASGDSHFPSNRAEQPLPERIPTSLTVSASPRFNF